MKKGLKETEESEFNEEIKEIDKMFTQSEDLIFIIETTAEYFEPINDWKPNKGYKILMEFNNLINNRLKLDPNDRYLIIFYNRKQCYTPIPNYTSNPTELLEFFSQLTPNPAGELPKLVEALSKASKIHLSTYRNIGNKTLRIILLTQTGSADDNNKIVNITQKILKNLNVITDIVKIGLGIIDNSIQYLVEETNGLINVVDTPTTLKVAFKKIEEKKKTLLKEFAKEYINYDIGIQNSTLINKFLESIASNLIKIPEKKNDSTQKCLICFNDICNHGIGSDHLLMCPKCNKPIHLCCAGLWSSQMKLNNPYVFRCPSCFFLLRVPHEYIDEKKVQKILKEKEKKIQQEQDVMKHEIKKEEDLKKSLLEFQQKSENERETTVIVLFKKWFEQVLPDLDIDEKNSIIKEFSILISNRERNEFIEKLRKSMNITGNDYPIY